MTPSETPPSRLDPFRRTAPVTRLALGLETMGALLLAGVMVRLLPFERVVGRFDLALDDEVAEIALPSRSLRHPDLETRRVGCWLDRLARVIYRRRPCLPAALAGIRMLARRGVRGELVLGVVRRPGSGLAAHAWLVAGGSIVTGAAAGVGHVPVTRFVLARMPSGELGSC